MSGLTTKLVALGVARPRLTVTLSALLAVVGMLAWFSMPRMEDPRLPDRAGMIVTSYPGADARSVEGLVVDRIEKALADVDAIEHVESTVRANVAITVVRLLGTTSGRKVDEAWDEVRERLARARRKLPAGAGEPSLDTKIIDTEAVLVALQGSGDPMRLSRAADRLEKRLLAHPQVARVEVSGKPREQVTIEYDDAVARRLGLSAAELVRRLAARNAGTPGGSLRVGGRRAVLRPRAHFDSVAALRRTPVVLPSGAALPLGQLARVRHGPAEPRREIVRVGGERAIVLGVVPRRAINLVAFGDGVRRVLGEMRAELRPLRATVVTFQPGRVATRLSELGSSLLLGVGIVALVLLVFMGMRVGLVVASVVPLVAFASLAIYFLGGGILHQISVAALVIALGILVDNAIVMAELVQAHVDAGLEAREAAARAVSELGLPLFSATGTTVAAFVPMLLSEGNSGDFVRAIPVVVILTMVLSYLFALLVTPALCALFLRRSKRGGGGGGGGDDAARATLLSRVSARLVALSTRAPKRVVAVALLFVAAAGAGIAALDKQFFPSGDRDQLVVSVELPEGAHIARTDAASRLLERALSRRPEVTRVAAFVGRSVPHFYYNLPRAPRAEHLAQLIVQTRSLRDVRRVARWLRGYASRALPEAQVITRTLQQGPPVQAPVEVRVVGDDLQKLARAANAVLRELRSVPGAVSARHDVGLGVPTLRFAVDDAAAGRRRLARAHVARALARTTRGLPLGMLRYGAGEDLVPIVVRASTGEHTGLTRLGSIDVNGDGPRARAVALASMASVRPQWRPAVIHHRDRRRLVTVRSQLRAGATYSAVLAKLRPRIAGLSLPDGVRVEYGGEAESSGRANAALFRAVPLAVILLLAFLLAEFNSFRRVLIINATVPLAAVGVIPGLLVGGYPFGFTALLGVFALVGIVVNNAIVLLEVVEAQRREGASVDAALGAAVAQRIRPILLTTATTVSGLLPLLFANATLWPPLAASMIAGLVSSTGLTLIVVPALYRLLFRDGDAAPEPARSSRPGAKLIAGGAALVVALLLAGGAAHADGTVRLSLDAVIASARSRPAVQAARAVASAEAARASVQWRRALLPTLSGEASVSFLSYQRALSTPIGSFALGGRRTLAAAAELRQPLFDPARLLFGAPASSASARARAAVARREVPEREAQAALSYIRVLAIDAQRRTTRAFVRSLGQRERQVLALVAAGRALESDVLKVKTALSDAQLALEQLRNQREVACRALALAAGRTGRVDVEPFSAARLPRALAAVAAAA
ncbi:MAG: efflux RND transporter permease subunit, partial [Myxococcales bacterium]|nr:efflux RND transporter permease subunit [Myxococcales bacterium]